MRITLAPAAHLRPPPSGAPASGTSRSSVTEASSFLQEFSEPVGALAVVAAPKKKLGIASLHVPVLPCSSGTPLSTIDGRCTGSFRPPNRWVVSVEQIATPRCAKESSTRLLDRVSSRFSHSRKEVIAQTGSWKDVTTVKVHGTTTSNHGRKQHLLAKRCLFNSWLTKRVASTMMSKITEAPTFAAPRLLNPSLLLLATETNLREHWNTRHDEYIRYRCAVKTQSWR